MEGIRINKLIGFYELKRLGIPSVKWEKYTKETQFNNDKLWTVRVAVQKGSDMNLPRAVGVTDDKAKEFAEKVRKVIKEDDLIIYYPYFIANISGNLKVTMNRYIIECIEGDLWNLVTDGARDETILYIKDSFERHGKKLLSEDQINELIKEGRKVKGKFRDEILEGKSILLEWSYAVETDYTGEKKGTPYLVFYECRTII